MKQKRKIKYIIILTLIAIIIPLNITLSRYVKAFIKNYLLETNKFYFNSDKLTEDGKTYSINNWSGVGTFELQFSLNNRKNNILKSESDIAYIISISCSLDILCEINSNSGILYQDEEKDDFTITITPTRAFEDNESISVSVTARATAPYTKTLSGTFVITVGKRGISYEIVDQENQPYLTFIITNALEEYKVKTAFGSYAQGDIISISQYMALTPTEQANCASTTITLDFDPAVVIADTTSSIVDNSIKTYTPVGGISYVSSITFDVEAASGIEIRFYKTDESQDYTYPKNDNQPIIDFTAT